MLDESNLNEITKWASQKSIVFFTSSLLIFATFCIVVFSVFQTSSPSFPDEGIIMQIDKGMNVKDIAQVAKEKKVVRSSTLLYGIITFLYDPTTIYAGTYNFSQPQNVFEVAKKLSLNDIDNTLMRITLPEGITRKDIADIASQNITDFDTQKFLELTKNNEGYLFPDTYYISPDFTAEELVTLLVETFALKVASLKDEIQQSILSEYDILILASILEREANDEISMRTVSGILQNRLRIGMALQTDASIEYVLDKPLNELEADDLKIDTPYNTYLYVGLTPTPIGNPGLRAIKAVLNPVKTNYLFYITDEQGIFYYAEDFEEHKRNIQKYLR